MHRLQSLAFQHGESAFSHCEERQVRVLVSCWLLLHDLVDLTISLAQSAFDHFAALYLAQKDQLQVCHTFAVDLVTGDVRPYLGLLRITQETRSPLLLWYVSCMPYDLIMAACSTTRQQ